MTVLTMASMLASTLRLVRVDGMDGHAALYDALRAVYLDGGSADNDATRRLATLHRVAPVVALVLRNRAARDRRDGRLASLPSGADLLAEALAARRAPTVWHGARAPSTAETIYDSPGRRTGD